MRKNFGSKPLLVPQPVLIIATYNEDGTPNAMNAAWGGVCGANEIMIDLGAHRTTDNLRRNKAFTVSIADAKHVVECDYVGVVSGKDAADKVAKAGFTVTKSEFVNAPVINELPLCIECELKEAQPDGKYIGVIKNVSVSEDALTDGKVDYAKLQPIVFDPFDHGYYKIGEKVGDAFSDGKKIK